MRAEAAGLGASTSRLEVYSTVTAGGIYTATVKHADDLRRVLGAGVELTEGARSVEARR